MDCRKCRKNSTDSSNSSDELNYASNKIKKEQEKRPLHQRILIGSGIGFVILIFVLFILIWVCIPITVWLSIALQRFLMFVPIDDPKNPTYDSPELYNLTGAINFYITTKDLYNPAKLASIGCWLVKPEDEMGTTTTDVTEIITNTKHDVIFYLHGVAQNRAKSVHQYTILRKYFLVIAIDHRGYGDSGENVTQSEAAIVDDHVQIYNWLRRKTQNNVYYWGHSLGTALSTHTVRYLRENNNLTIKGLILESPFTTMREEILSIVVGKVFSWLAYFNATVLHPLDYNGFHFYSSTNILWVDCPIMIMHAEDDNVVPYFLGKRLAEIAQTQRDSTCQGSVTYHQFPAVGYQHVGITEDPNVPQFIEEFIEVCDTYQKKQKTLVDNGTCNATAPYSEYLL